MFCVPGTAWYVNKFLFAEHGMFADPVSSGSGMAVCPAIIEVLVPDEDEEAQ